MYLIYLGWSDRGRPEEQGGRLQQPQVQPPEHREEADRLTGHKESRRPRYSISLYISISAYFYLFTISICLSIYIYVCIYLSLYMSILKN